MMAAASNAALVAPAVPMAKVATGMPAGICTMDSSESIPLRAFDCTGTPSTGKLVFAAVMPVLGVPVQSKALNGMDSLLSIVQMPAGIPVATFAIGAAGATNAALLAAAIIANRHPEVLPRLEAFREKQTARVLEHPDPRISTP